MYFPVGGNIGHSYEKVEELYLPALNMELTIVTQFQVVCAGVNIEMNTSALEHSPLISHLQRVRAKSALTEVIGTVLILVWVLC